MDRLPLQKLKENAGKFRQTFSNTLNDLLHLAAGRDEHEEAEGVGGQEEAAGADAATHGRPEDDDSASGRKKGSSILRDAWNAYTIQGREGSVFCDVLDALSQAYDGSIPSSPGRRKVSVPHLPRCGAMEALLPHLVLTTLALLQAPHPVNVALALGPQNDFGAEIARKIAASAEAILRTVGTDGCDIFAEVCLIHHESLLANTPFPGGMDLCTRGITRT